MIFKVPLMTMQTPHFQIGLLGGFRVNRGSTPVQVVPGTRRLLALLALHEQPVPYSEAARLLWPTAIAQRAVASLRSTLWRLHSSPAPMVEVAGDALRLSADVGVDFRRARHFAAAPGANPDVVAMFLEDLLPGWWDPWVTSERDWWRQARLRALEVLSDRFRSSGDHHSAHRAALAAVQADPLHENAQRTLVELHLANGNPAQAVRQYHTYRTRLRTERGISPSPRISALVQPLL